MQTYIHMYMNTHTPDTTYIQTCLSLSFLFCHSHAALTLEAIETHAQSYRGTAAHCNTCNTKHCHTLQHTATQCNTMQHPATHCNTLQHTASRCNTLQHTAMQVSGGCSFSASATASPTGRGQVCVAECCSVLPCVAVCGSVLQCVVLQCVAVCCRVL